jgi:uncharacterized membrane protein (DUF4010 family)
VLAACTILLLRVALMATILNPSVTLALTWYVLPPLAVGATFVGMALTRRPPDGEPTAPKRPDSPLGLWSSLKMAVGFQIVLTALPFIERIWGTSGVLASAALLGMTDVDALTLSMCRLTASPESVGIAAGGIAIGILSNTVVKLGIAVAIGTGSFRRRASLGLGAFAVASLLGLWLAGLWR